MTPKIADLQHQTLAASSSVSGGERSSTSARLLAAQRKHRPGRMATQTPRPSLRQLISQTSALDLGCVHKNGRALGAAVGPNLRRSSVRRQGQSAARRLTLQWWCSTPRKAASWQVYTVEGGHTARGLPPRRSSPPWGAAVQTSRSPLQRRSTPWRRCVRSDQLPAAVGIAPATQIFPVMEAPASSAVALGGALGRDGQ